MNQENRKNGILRQSPQCFLKSVSLFWKFVMVITLVITLLMGLAIVSAKFADWYRAGICTCFDIGRGNYDIFRDIYDSIIVSGNNHWMFFKSRM